MSHSIRIEEASVEGCPYGRGMCLYRFEDTVLEQAFYRDSLGLGLRVVSDEIRVGVGRAGIPIETLTARDPEPSLLDEILVEIAS